mmetsp:Transcript_21384/g.32700  ORF Transcript_21384/g.32700 Transcript_21384/m.32700 type:complete len:92 (+) Transcript_21384:651-926(+)
MYSSRSSNRKSVNPTQTIQLSQIINQGLIQGKCEKMYLVVSRLFLFTKARKRRLAQAKDEHESAVPHANVVFSSSPGNTQKLLLKCTTPTV